MPYYIIKTSKGYYQGYRDNFPVYSPEVTYQTWVCGTKEEEATDDFDFHRGLIIKADGLEAQPTLIKRKSMPLPPSDPMKRLEFSVLAPPEGWKILDFFGKRLALMTDGQRFAIRTNDNTDTYTDGKMAAAHWCMIREHHLRERMDKLVGGGGGG